MPLIFIAPINYASQSNTQIPTYDTYIPYTMSMLHGDGSGGSSTIADSVGGTWAATGSTLSTAKYKYGSASMSFSGSSGSHVDSSARADYALGSGDFTVECWIYPTSFDLSATTTFFDNRTGVTSTACTWGITQGGLGLTWFDGPNGVSYNDVYQFNLNQWYFLSVVRANGVLYQMVNGLCIGAHENNTNYGSYQPIRLGAGQNSAEWFAGYIDEFRMTVGVSRYVPYFWISELPVDSSKDPYWSNVALRMTFNGSNGGSTFTDFSQNGYTTVSTGVTNSNTQVKFGTASAAFSNTSAQYLTVGVPTSSLPTTQDFTLEFWAWVTPGTTTSPGPRMVSTRLTSNALTGMVVSCTDNNVSCTLGNGSSWLTTLSQVDSNFTLGAWHHVVVTRKSNTAYLIIDGLTRAQASISGTLLHETFVLGYDLGSQVSSSRFSGYIDDLRLTVGTSRYGNTIPQYVNDLTDVTSNSNIARPVGIAITAPLLTNNNFIDQTGVGLVTRNGGNPGMSQGTFSPFSNTGWSVQFTGSSNLGIGAAINLTADFTIECWVYPTAIGTATQMLLANVGTAGQSDYFGIDNTGLSLGFQTGSHYYASNSVTILNNTWYHVALVRSNGTLTYYVNGVAQGTASNSQALMSAGTTVLGDYFNNVNFFTGYVSNMRVTTNVVYAGAFTPPTNALTSISGTVLLCCMDNRFIDRSGTYSLTTAASLIRAFSPFSPSTYSASTNGGSMYFDGTGDYLKVSTTFSLGGDFTIEAWIYRLGNSDFGIFCIGSTSAGNNGLYLYAAQSGGIRVYQNAAAIFTNDSAVNGLKQWYHVALVRSGTGSNNNTVYVNGVVSGTYTNNVTVVGTSIIGGKYDTSYTISSNGYQTDTRLTQSAVYTSAFSVPTAPLPVLSSTLLLLNGTSSAALDQIGGNVVETVGTSSTTTSKVKWSSSVAFNGTTDYLLTPSASGGLIFGTSDFTIECWFYLNSTATSGLVDFRSIVAAGYPVLGVNTSAAISFGAGSTWNITGSTLTTGQWYHVAVCRSSGVTKLFLNGVQVGSSYTDSNVYGCNSLRIGGTIDPYYLNGYVEDVRITRAARYGGTFTPPAAAFTTVGDSFAQQTVFLLKPSNSTYTSSVPVVIESSSSQLLTSTVGTVCQGSFNPYGSRWSIKFNGTSDAIQLSDNAAFQMGTGDFTVEHWVCVAYMPGQAPRLFGYQDYSGAKTVLTTGLNLSGQFQGELRDASGSGDNTLTSTTVATLGQWYHVAFTRQSGVTSLWVNGKLEATASGQNQNVAAGTPGVGAFKGNTSNFYAGLVSNLRLVKGTAVYTAPFVPPTANLTAISGTSFFIAASRGLTDLSANKLSFDTTSYGAPTVVALSPFQPQSLWNTGAGGSMYFNGSSYLTPLKAASPLNIGSNDFTIECWFYLNSTSTSGLLDLRSALGAGYPALGISSNSITYSAGSTWNITGSTLTTGQWYHVAVCRSSGVTKLFLNGVQVGSSYTDSNVYACAQSPFVGSLYNLYYLNGFISDLRVVVGTALYTAAFTPPTSQLTAVTNTKLLLNFVGSTYVDQLSRTDYFPVGTPQASTQMTKFGTSLYLNGSSGVYATNQIPISNTDFTVAAWIYPTTVAPQYQGVVDLHSASSQTATGLGLMVNYATMVVWTGSSVLTGGVIVANTWQHVAITRQNGVISLWVNGIVISQVANTTTFTDNGTYIGMASTSTQLFTGWIEQPIVKRYYIAQGGYDNSMWSQFTPPTGAFVETPSTTITLLTNRTNFNLKTAIGAAYVVGSTNAVVTIGSGVVINSSSNATPAFDTGTGWTTGDTITIINNGTIIGAGGAGGSTVVDGTSGAGTAGGTGLALNFAATITNASGSIAGGGGGGGAGASHSGYLGGGGGGAGSLPGVGGTNGAAGTATTGGAGYTDTHNDGAGGNGGGLGAAGAAGAQDGWLIGSPGAGGAAGKAIALNGKTLTWVSGSSNVIGAIA